MSDGNHILPQGDPEQVGMSSERLDRLSDAMRGYVDRGEMAGASTLVARRGRVVHLECYGSADVERGVPIDPSTLYRIASMTKPITSVAAMMLFEEGRLALNEPVETYLPELAAPEVVVADDSPDGFHLEPARRPITARHLLTHTAGYTYGDEPALADFYRASRIPGGFENWDEALEAAVTRLGAVPLLFHPGEGWAYGVSTDVVGRLVEAVSGQSLDAFFQERIFGPLGMGDTRFFLRDEDVPRLAGVYEHRSDEGLRRVESDYPYNGPGTLFMGGAGLCSTITDYGAFCQMMLNGGRLGTSRILSRPTVALMCQNHIGELTPGHGPGHKFGLGFCVHTDAGLTGDVRPVGSYFWGGYWHTTFWMDPVEDLFAVKMSQMFPADHLDDHEAFRALVYGAIDD